MRVEELDYYLPPELLAREPIETLNKSRDEARLLVMLREAGKTEHDQFNHISKYLRKDDLLVLNNSKTINALLHGFQGGRRRVEVRLCTTHEGKSWYCTVRPERDLTEGTTFAFGDQGELTARIVGQHKDLPALWLLQFESKEPLLDVLERIGKPVISPYVSQRWGLNYYQTTYAAIPGSAEMPSAGRHFTPELLASLAQQGIKHVFVTLHTGLSSVRIGETKFEEHKMYEEYAEVSPPIAEAINTTKQKGGRVVGVGTTVTRTLETAGQTNGKVEAGAFWTNLYIYPGFKFKVLDALVTNFHGARTSRIALAAAFTGKDLLMRGYKEAIERRYRFFEFGDSTLTI